MKQLKNIFFRIKTVAIKLATVVVFALFSIHSFAATNTWTGPSSGGDWAIGTNWSGGNVPVATDSVLIGSGNVVTLSTDAGKINGLTVRGKLNVTSTGILTIEQNVVSKALLLIEGGEVDNAGSITLTQKLSNSVSGIALADGLANSTIRNTGTLNVNMNFTGANSKSDCVTFKQTTGGTATFVAGGTMTFTPNPNNKIIFQNLTGNGQIDGTAVIGSSGSYLNARLLQIAGGNLTIVSTASIEIYSKLTSGAIVIMNNAGTVSVPSYATLTNNGILKVHASSAVTSNALQFSPGAYATSTLTNSGTVILDGVYSSSNGVILCAGSDATSYSVINNLSGGTISATNSYGTSITTGGTGKPALVASVTKNATVNNSGNILLSATDKCIIFGAGLCTFNNNSGGYVTVNTGITGASTTACNFYNNSGATFDFNLPNNPNVGSFVDAYKAISSSGKILFTNSGGTVTGRGFFDTDLFVPSNGKIAPGNASGGTPYGQIQVNGATQNYTQSTLALKIGGTTAGTNYDQLLIGTAGAAVNISSATLNLTFNAAYTPTYQDNVDLIKTSTATAPTITGNFASTSLPIGWTLNYTSGITGLVYSPIIVSSNSNISGYSPNSTKDLIVSAGYELTIDADATLKALTATPGAKLTLAPGKSLTVVGALTLQSNSLSTATFVDNGGTLNAGSTNVEQYLTTGRNWYICSPVNGAKSSVFTATTNNPLYYYNEAASVNASANAWTQVTNTTTTLYPTMGYIANLNATLLSNQNNIITFSGESFGTGTITTGQNGVPALSYTENNYKKGFNLIGNPYPSYLDWDNVIKSNVSSSIWLRTKVSNAYLFDTYNALGQLGTSNSGISINNHIPPMQSFWVRATAPGASLSFTNSLRSHKGSQTIGEGEAQITINDRSFKAPARAQQSVLKLQISNGSLSDETILYTNPKALNTFDDYDTPKMFSNNAALAEIYMVSGAEQVAINGLDSIPYETELPIGLNILSSGLHSIKAAHLSNFVPGTQIILKDYTNPTNPVITDLTDGSAYLFNSGLSVNNTSRFSLVFRLSSNTTSINQDLKSNINVSVSQNQIIVSGANAETSLIVYNQVGQRLGSYSLTPTSTSLGAFLPGMYVLAIKNEGNIIAKKVIIK